MTTELTKAAQQAQYLKSLADRLDSISEMPGDTLEAKHYLSEYASMLALTQRPAAQTEREAWQLINPQGQVVAVERTAIKALARIDGYKPTVEGLLGYEEAGWRVVPASLPAPQQATPAQEPGVFREYFDAHRALIAAKGVSERASHAHIVGYRAPSHSTGSEPYAASVARNDQLKRADDAARCARKEAEARFNAALSAAQSATQQATPEPVGEPWGWAVNSTLFRGEFAEADAKAEAMRCGGTTRAVALYARRGAGVPEADPLQGAVDWFWQAIPHLKAHDVANRLSIGCNRAARLLAAAQANGGE